jgi:hypothetical protein
LAGVRAAPTAAAATCLTLGLFPAGIENQDDDDDEDHRIGHGSVKASPYRVDKFKTRRHPGSSETDLVLTPWL